MTAAPVAVPVTVERFRSVEIALGAAVADPWAELDVVVSAPGGADVVVPAFVRGGVWRFRYSSGELGSHGYRAGESTGRIEVTPRVDGVPAREGVPIRVAASGRRFEYADGVPFLWVGDTWWHGFVTAKIDDEEFRDFAGERAREGFSVIQVVVLPPEAGPFDAAVASAAGWPWTEGFEAINPSWWDDADRRIAILLDEGLVPCIVGSWGYHLGMMDDRQARRHWREMVARWSALPVTWCLAGEPSMLWYDDPGYRELLAELDAAPQSDRAARYRELSRRLNRDQLARLNLVARSLRDLDPFGRPATTHMVPGEMPWELLDDVGTIDFWMLQTGHAGHRSLPAALNMLEEAYRYEPAKPVVNGESAYEGIGGSNWEDIQRLQFWSHLLSGAAGHTYGAHGIWAMNTEEFPAQFSGSAPTWKVARTFSGARSVGFAGRLLRGLDWFTLAPRSDLVATPQTADDRFRPYAADLADGTRIVYLPSYAFYAGGVVLRSLGAESWTVTYVDLGTGEENPAFTLTPDASGNGDLGLGLISRPTWGDILILVRPMPSDARV